MTDDKGGWVRSIGQTVRGKIDDLKTEHRESLFVNGPVGSARQAHAEGLSHFQCGITVGGRVFHRQEQDEEPTYDASVVLDAIAAEGWQLVHAGFVYEPHSQQSRDRLLGTGQDTLTTGITVGYYVFRRAD